MKENIVYVIQEIPGTKSGNPKINIMGASDYGNIKFLLPELSQIIFSPGPLVFKLRQGLKDFTKNALLHISYTILLYNANLYLFIGIDMKYKVQFFYYNSLI